MFLLGDFHFRSNRLVPLEGQVRGLHINLYPLIREKDSLVRLLSILKYTHLNTHIRFKV